MKVKNIVFSGFAAAVLMGVAADANAAATEVATKAYVDRLGKPLVGEDGSYIKTVVQEEGFVTATKTGFAQEITSGSDHSNAPTSKAVHDYVTTAVNGVQYGGDNAYITVDNTTDKIGLTNIAGEASGISDGSTALTTANAVFDYVTANEYIEGDYIDINDTTNAIAVTNITEDASGITIDSDLLTTGKAVYDFVRENDTTYTGSSYITIDANNNNAITVNDVTDLGTGIDTGDAGLTTGNAVHEYVTTTVNNLGNTLTAAPGKYVSGVTQTNGKLTSVAETGFETTISVSNHSTTNAPTADAVYQYVNTVTGGVLPTNRCTTNNCALVFMDNEVKWVDLTTPLN